MEIIELIGMIALAIYAVSWIALPSVIKEIRNNLKEIADGQRVHTEALRDLTKEISKISQSIKEKDKH